MAEDNTAPGWALEKSETGYTLTGPYKEDRYYELALIGGDINRAISPDLKNAPPPIVWGTGADWTDWLPPEPPFKWRLIESNYPANMSNREPDYKQELFEGTCAE